MLEILHCLTPVDERDLCGDWLGKLKGVTAKIAIVRRIIRIGRGEKKMKSKMNDDAMAEMYREDPEFALQLINDILENGDQAELLIVLRQMAKAFGGMQEVAEQAHLNSTQLYRTLSPQGNPALSSLSAILKVMGLRLAIQPLQARSTPA